MLVAAGGGGAGGTPWGMLTMQKMQELIQNPDTEKHYELLTGWKKSADLLVEHRWQVQNYRDNLAAVWPPEKNAASEAYIARLNELITNLSDTYEAALANHDAFAAATLSLSLAQKKMDEIAREYESNDQLLTTHAANQQSTNGRPQPTPNPSGEQPPVAPGRQQELHQTAVTLLNGVSADLALAQVNVRTPTLYEPIRIRQETRSGSDESVYVAPPIPPITPTFGAENATTAPSRLSATFPAPTASQPISPLPPTTQPGLILGGANPLAVAPPITGITPASAPLPNGGGPATSPGFISPLGPGTVPSRGAPAAPPSTHGQNRVSGIFRESLSRPGATAGGAIHALPAGGIIGGAPGVGVGQPGGKRAAARINPVGGVIGGADAHNGVGSRGTSSGSAAPYGQVGGRASQQSKKSDHLSWDPDNPWETAEGVDPVLLPSQQRKIDPGPVIGSS